MAEVFYARRRRISGINIVPLIDVMTVLIFFFLMSMKFDDVARLGITPPSADSAAKGRTETRLVAAVTGSGEFFINSEPVPAAEFADALAARAKRLGVASLVLVADEDAATKHTVFVVDQAQKHGLQVQLLTRSPNE